MTESKHTHLVKELGDITNWLAILRPLIENETGKEIVTSLIKRVRELLKEAEQ